MKARLGALAFVSVAFLMAPTPGDTGGCGVTAETLDVNQFGESRKIVDCQRCTECNITTMRCKNACIATIAPDVAFPATCEPLREDGLICLRALSASSCDDYARFMDDTAPEVPTECQFCRVTTVPPATLINDGSAPSTSNEAPAMRVMLRGSVPASDGGGT